MRLEVLCSRGELFRIAWKPGIVNPADSFTKIQPLKSTKSVTQLHRLMKYNNLDIHPVGWTTVSREVDAQEFQLYLQTTIHEIQRVCERKE